MWKQKSGDFFFWKWLLYFLVVVQIEKDNKKSQCLYISDVVSICWRGVQVFGFFLGEGDVCFIIVVGVLIVVVWLVWIWLRHHKKRSWRVFLCWLYTILCTWRGREFCFYTEWSSSFLTRSCFDLNYDVCSWISWSEHGNVYVWFEDLSSNLWTEVLNTDGWKCS